ncbi:MAG: nuclear transport factor 2 family protein [Deltaproteobacteria bacterium]|nr:nuclear transport factor 2 family protein [Deltaproteobacteria bacterium]
MQTTGHTDLWRPATIAVMCMSATLLGGCGEDTTEGNEQDTGQNRVMEESPRNESDEDAPLPEFTELSVQELLHRWIDAQNKLNFDAYAALYTTRFDGIDESGDVTVRYVREQWLNRAEMLFKKSAQLTVDETSIHLFVGGAEISLVEHMSFADTTHAGRRQLLIVAEDGRLKIAREKLLPTTPLPDTGEKNEKHKILEEFFFVLDNRYVVFSTTDMENDGALYVNRTTALKRARKEVVPRKFRRLLRRKFIVSYEDGSTEIMKLTDTRAIARYAVHAAIESYWKKQGLSEVEMGELLWEMASRAGSVYLVGILKETKRGALWAHPVRPRTPEIYGSRKLDGAYIKNIKRRFRRRLESKTLQSLFERTNGTGNWMDYEPASYGRLFKSPRGNRKFAAVSISAGKGCGDFYGSLNGFFHIQKGVPYDFGMPSNFFQDAFIDDRRVIQTIDIDHDGIPEFVGKNKLMYKIDDDWFVYELKSPLTDCPC